MVARPVAVRRRLMVAQMEAVPRRLVVARPEAVRRRLVQQLGRPQSPPQQLVVALLPVARPEAMSRSLRALVSWANAGGSHSRRDLFGQALMLRP